MYVALPAMPLPAMPLPAMPLLAMPLPAMPLPAVPLGRVLQVLDIKPFIPLADSLPPATTRTPVRISCA